MNTDLSSATTVGDAARAVPSAAGVFDRFGIDYRCGGRLTIAQDCSRVRADPDAVLAALNAPKASDAAEADCSLADITGLCDHIQSTHHAFVRNAIDRLAGLMPRVINAHAARHPWLTRLESALAQLRAELFDHMFREKRVFFPWLRRLDRSGVVTHGPPWSIKQPSTAWSTTTTFPGTPALR